MTTEQKADNIPKYKLLSWLKKGLTIFNSEWKSIPHVYLQGRIDGYIDGAKDKWVKVEDALPEIYTEVLGWWFQKECPVVCVHEKDGVFKSSWDMTEIIITHWQPITPPQD